MIGKKVRIKGFSLFYIYSTLHYFQRSGERKHITRKLQRGKNRAMIMGQNQGSVMSENSL